MAQLHTAQRTPAQRASNPANGDRSNGLSMIQAYRIATQRDRERAEMWRDEPLNSTFHYYKRLPENDRKCFVQFVIRQRCSHY